MSTPPPPPPTTTSAPASVSGGYQDPLETWSDKFARKFNENPWVPLGCLATCGALIMSAAKLRAGKPKDMNYWLRARVGLQGLTVGALLLGSTWGREWMKEKFGIESARSQSASSSSSSSSAGETGKETETEAQKHKKAQEKREFEERLRNAEEVTRMEKAVGVEGGKMTVKGPVVNKPKEDKEPTTATSTSTTEAVKQSGGWRFWGGKSSSPSPSAEGKDGADSTSSTKTS
ncbi:Respiratory supercomplex factor 1, mitochondrial [Psilocybe cubensis]|uniref:HIG1 domain-containing protein n=2 Tax=Psilocybe cubensis TaxID=181762 RepID=A0A8H8CIC1_PSICU|nr:Respiratory supercomplex factor 1, mitochondrial [Psilocybe cubensis]KAH9474749.1 Respiratory supercomplex factor 1, mitochondrial [Psilocybe cubensis]